MKNKFSLTTISTSCLLLFLTACGQNAHVTAKNLPVQAQSVSPASPAPAVAAPAPAPVPTPSVSVVNVPADPKTEVITIYKPVNISPAPAGPSAEIKPGSLPSQQNLTNSIPDVKAIAPVPDLKLVQTYVGDDQTQGQYKISVQLQDSQGQSLSLGSDDKIQLSIVSANGQQIFFSGEFQGGKDLRTLEPLSVDPHSLMSWKDILPSIPSGLIADGKDFVFDKRSWALDQGHGTFYYRLFNPEHTLVLPLEERKSAQEIRIGLRIKTAAGTETSSDVILPVRYRYAFDDDSLGPAERDGQGGETMVADQRITSRVIQGLEYVSLPEILSRDTACKKTWNLKYGFEFVNVQNTYGQVQVLATRSGKVWTPAPAEWTGQGVIDTAAKALGGGGAQFTPVAGYGGLCNFKVWGVVLANRFTAQAIDGLQMQFHTRTNHRVKAIFGVTVMEAF